jgi:biotin operon repressor
LIAELNAGFVKTNAPVKRRPLRWFVPMPARMALDTGVSHAAFRLASVLLHHEGERGCFPSQSRLSEALGISEDSVARYLRELELYGFLTRKKRTGFHNIYLLAPLYEPPIGHGSIEETGQLEVENAPKRRPPASRELRIPRPDPGLQLQTLAPVKPIEAAHQIRSKTNSVKTTSAAQPTEQPPAPARVAEDIPNSELPAPVRLVETARFVGKAIGPPASVRVNGDVDYSIPPAPTRAKVPAPAQPDPPHACGSNKNHEVKNHQHQDVGEGTRRGGEEEKITGLGALQRANVNVGRSDLGKHEGRGRALDDEELRHWAVWVSTGIAPEIANKAAFCASKIRIGCKLEEVFPAVAFGRRREGQAADAAAAAEVSEEVERQRVDRADALIAAMAATDRKQLRGYALRDSSVWIARNASRAIFSVMLAAAERRLVLGEAQPCSIDRDLTAYREIPSV